MEKEIIQAIKQVQESIEKIKIPDTVNTIEKPHNIVFTKLKNMTSTSIKKPDTPDFVVTNEHTIPLKLNQYSIIPNTTFQTKGSIMITVGDGEHILFENDIAGDFEAAREYVHIIPKGLILNRGEKIKVYIWNGVDSATLKATVALTLVD